MNNIFADCEGKMKKTTEHFVKELGSLRTGRASTSVLDGIKVPYYGNEMPINQVASMAVIEAKTIDIKPWDKGALSEIEKAVISSNLGVSVTNTGDSLKVRFPELTEETRKDMVKKVKKMAEETKVDVRNIRRDANEKAKEKEKNKEVSEDELKNAEGKIQKITDKAIADIDHIAKQKEEELMKI
ncbi:MAG: ribosome recycling factor [Candidatus Goldiibacteriota bacterium HGW-Goldbacteria-1]|jgi:ribosome recycling factor|nr:MAG: ribosome recycling factor [Candidatus Goldiibacteriota bacterium HGW-Goldbacteria-1]